MRDDIPLSFWTSPPLPPTSRSGSDRRPAARCLTRIPLSYKDAVFLSPHKFIGGPQTPCILVVRRQLVRNTVPTVPGGGTSTTRSRTPSRKRSRLAVRASNRVGLASI